MTWKQYWAQPDYPRDVAGFGVFAACMFVCWPWLLWRALNHNWLEC